MTLQCRRRARVALGVTGIALGVVGAGVAGGAVTPPGTVGKTTVFHGRIVSGTKIYAGSHGTVRLILTSGGGPIPDSLLGVPTYSFTMAVSGSKCLRRTPPGCVTLTGTLQGTADVNGRSSYDLEPSEGRISPLGRIAFAAGVITSRGTNAHRRIIIILILQGKAGTIRIEVRSSIVPGVPSPF
jgi:hypothetical protein